MILKILHLYHDLLNLYGEVGNIKILAKHLMEQKIEVIVERSTVGDEINFSDYDFIYLGSGTEKNQLVALKDLLRYKHELSNAIDDGLVMLATGNSLEIFGQYIRDLDGQKHDALKIFSFYTERSKTRTAADIVYSTDFLTEKIIGFVNKASMVYAIDNYLFKVEFGIGANESSKQEGLREKNFFGTYVIGPLLVRNPHFLHYLARLICRRKDPAFDYQEIIDEHQYLAYQTALRELSKRMV